MIASSDGHSDDQQPPGESGGDRPYYVTDDGLLALTVFQDVDGEALIGFHGFEWNIQVSILSEVLGTSPEEALQTFIADVLQDRSVIAILKMSGELCDVWITDSPKVDLQYVQFGEELSFRYWSGKAAPIE